MSSFSQFFLVFVTAIFVLYPTVLVWVWLHTFDWKRPQVRADALEAIPHELPREQVAA